MYKILFVIIFLFNTLTYFAQSYEGLITDSMGNSLPYAYVRLKKTNIATRTDLDGKFKVSLKGLNLPLEDTIIVTYIGYNDYIQKVFLSNSNPIASIKLEEEFREIEEVIIVALQPFPPIDIVKFAIKNQKKNYIQKTTLTNGFYRETIQEENKWIQLNEAVIELKYSKYPQKHFLNKAVHKAYYKYDLLPWNISISSLFSHLERFPGFIPIDKDQVKIINSRHSLDDSKNGINVNPIGGPGDLVATDKLKYLYDFFDPKLIDKYKFKSAGQTHYNNELCYIIDFIPLEITKGEVYHGLNEKMDVPIYMGRILISGKNFAVVHFEYELVEKINFTPKSSNKKDTPYYLRCIVDYKKIGEKWILSSVETTQKKDDWVNNKLIHYTCKRSLILDSTIYKNVKFPDDSIAYITKSFTLKDYENTYNESFWTAFEKSEKYPEIDPKIKKDLEKEFTLEKQFLSLNQPIDSIQKPHAKTIDYKKIFMNDTLFDQYHWIMEKDSNTINYLIQENGYSKAVYNKLQQHGKTFTYRYNNILNESPSSNSYDTVKYQMIDNHKIKMRNDDSNQFCWYELMPDGTEKFLLNYSQLIAQKTNFIIENVKFSKTGVFSYLYSVKDGYTKTLVVSNVNTEPKDWIKNGIQDYYWLNDSSIVYSEYDSKNRACKLKQFDFKNMTETGLYIENDESKNIYIDLSKSEKYIFLSIRDLVSSQTYYLERGLNSKAELRKLTDWQNNTQYEFQHDATHNKSMYAIHKNDQGNYFLKELSIGETDQTKWKIIYESEHPIDELLILKDFIVLKIFNQFTHEMKVVELKSNKVRNIEFPEKICGFYPYNSDKKDQPNTFDLIYNSPITAAIHYEFNVETNLKKELEKITVDKDSTYRNEIIYATSKDLTQIPIRILCNKTIKYKGVILKTYGAYGYRESSNFNHEDIVYASLGYAVAYAYVRGGGELGDEWHNQGKYLHKINTFDDYKACALKVTEYFKISSKQLVGKAGSAGGVIMGYAANNYPELFGALIFDRPFLDVVNEMSDTTTSMTVMQYSEWGNPKDKVCYDYQKKYSPYQNIKKQAYPNMLFLTGYYDYQVPYWQVAKSVAKFRENNTGNSQILLKTMMKSGHKGSTVVAENTQNMLLQYAFIVYSLTK